MAALVKSHGLDSCQWALDQIRIDMAEAEKLGAHAVGRKKDYDADALRDVWVFVEAGRALNKRTVKAFCANARFMWVEGGSRGVKVSKEIGGETLRRRYQDAARYMQDASAPVKKFWRQLAENRIAQLSGKDP